MESCPTSSLKDANDRVTETSEALEEERRLLYVAITCERRTLYFFSAIFQRKEIRYISFLYTVRKDLPEKTSTK